MTNSVEELLSILCAALKHSPPDLTKAKSVIPQLKSELVKLPLFPPFIQSSGTVQQPLLLGREAFELLSLFAIYSKDLVAFYRSYTQLKPFYSDYNTLLPSSERTATLVSCWLLYLLTQNQLAEFHAEWEWVTHCMPVSLISSAPVQYVRNLEILLSEGCYSKVLAARQNVIVPEFSFFFDTLAKTVRHKIAECSEAAYRSYPADQLSVLLMCSSEEAQQIAKERGWKADSRQVIFPALPEAIPEIPSRQMIAQSLEYATELEKIV